MGSSTKAILGPVGGVPQPVIFVDPNEYTDIRTCDAGGGIPDGYILLSVIYEQTQFKDVDNSNYECPVHSILTNISPRFVVGLPMDKKYTDMISHRDRAVKEAKEKQIAVDKITKELEDMRDCSRKMIAERDKKLSSLQECLESKSSEVEVLSKSVASYEADISAIRKAIGERDMREILGRE